MYKIITSYFYNKIFNSVKEINFLKTIFIYAFFVTITSHFSFDNVYYCELEKSAVYIMTSSTALILRFLDFDVLTDSTIETGLIICENRCWLEIYSGCSSLPGITDFLVLISSFYYKFQKSLLSAIPGVLIIFLSILVRNIVLFFVSFYYYESYSIIKPYTSPIIHIGLITAIYTWLWLFSRKLSLIGIGS